MNPEPQYYPVTGGGIVPGGDTILLASILPLLDTSLWARHRYWHELPPDGTGLLARPTLGRS